MIALFLLAAAPAVAAADSNPAPRTSDQAARTVVAVFAHCAVEREPDLARRTILEDWDARRIVKDRRLLASGCIGRGMQLWFQANTLKAALAGLLIDRDLKPADAATVAQSPALAYTMPDPLRTVDDKGRQLSASRIERQQKAIAFKASGVAIAQFGECVARANPAAVPPLARTVFGSDAESAALKAFWPNLPPCLPAGVKMEVDRPTLRNAITLAYYRLAMAVRQPQTAQVRR